MQILFMLFIYFLYLNIIFNVREKIVALPPHPIFVEVESLPTLKMIIIEVNIIENDNPRPS
jgi:hypothetical protein